MLLQKAFKTLLPELDATDRCFVLLEPDEDKENKLVGSYELVDLYCQVPNCDCQKVSVIAISASGEILATLAYGWETIKYYKKWGLDSDTAKQLIHVMVDPMAMQSQYSNQFLGIFRMLLKNQPGFLERFQSRYALFKKSITQNYAKKNNVIPFTKIAQPGRNDICSCGSGKKYKYCCIHTN